jgi:hypothetical protein
VQVAIIELACCNCTRAITENDKPSLHLNEALPSRHSKVKYSTADHIVNFGVPCAISFNKNNIKGTAKQQALFTNDSIK